MTKKRKLLSQLLIICVMALHSSCSIFAKENVPYIVKGSFVTDGNSTDYEICGAEIYFLNKSEKNVTEFTVVFSLFDGYGEPFNTTKNNLVFSIKEELEPMESINICLSLDEYVNTIPDDNTFIDYLYVSHIMYGDTSEWKDPFGFKIF